LVTKGENLCLQGGAGPKTTQVIKAKRATRKEFIVERNIISRMIVNPEFSDRTQFSVGTG
jgi:hypothetical protein